MPQNNTNELDEILTTIIIDHEDSDQGTCASNYALCPACSEKVYRGNMLAHRRRHPGIVNWVQQPCNCRVKDEIAEANTTLTAWNTRQCLEAERQSLYKLQHDENYVDHTAPEFRRAIAERQAEITRELVKLEGQS
jgi:hypothetical protein